MITDEIEAAGGIRAWSHGDIEVDDHERRVWHWLKTYTDHIERVHLGYGTGDRFVAAHAMMASLLPQDHVEISPGGHDWSTWRNIWVRLLDHNITNKHARPL